MDIHMKGRRRFRRRSQRADSSRHLGLLGAAAVRELERGCRGRLALVIDRRLIPEMGPEGVEVPGRGPDLGSLAAILGRKFLWFVLLAHLFWIGTTSLLIASYKFVQPSATVLMAWRAWGDGWKITPPRPVSLRSVPVWLRSMLVSVEDYRFYEHHGFDLEAIKRAYEIDRRLGEPMYGGSTLTMQVARTLFLVPAKSYFRKYLEVIVTAELETILDKRRILELYFGYAEWGKGLFGIDATARHWYGKSVRGLDRDEGARLVAILSSPIKYRPNWFGRSLILRERYDFLAKRFLPSLEPAAIPIPPPADAQKAAEGPQPLPAAAPQVPVEEPASLEGKAPSSPLPEPTPAQTP